MHTKVVYFPLHLGIVKTVILASPLIVLYILEQPRQWLGNCFTDLSKFLNERLLSKFLKVFETEHALAMIEFYSYRLTQHFYTHNMPPSQLKLDDQSWYWPCERFYYTTRSLIAILLLSVIIGIGNLVTVENRLVFRRVHFQ